MKEQIEEKNTEMGSVITRSEEFVRKNQKAIIIAVCAIVVVIVAIFALKKWYFEPRENRASEEMFAAEQWFAQGEFQKSLEGDDTYRGFDAIIDQYGSTKAGNLAHYYAAVANLRLGNYDQALAHAKKYNGRDTFTRPISTMIQADALIEQGQTKEAASLYEKAAREGDNFITAPTALFRAGMAYVILGQKADALRCFQQVKEKYPESTEWPEIDKYIGLVAE